jgi:hypothetical protein
MQSHPWSFGLRTAPGLAVSHSPSTSPASPSPAGMQVYVPFHLRMQPFRLFARYINPELSRLKSGLAKGENIAA